ncbi:Histone 2A, partial [Pseudoloma neurophilia]
MASAKGGKRDPIQTDDLVDGKRLFGGSRPRRLLKASTGLRVGREGVTAASLACGFFIAEILDLARHECEAESKKKITPRHINLGMSKDNEMSVISSQWLIKGGGVKHPATAEMLRG